MNQPKKNHLALFWSHVGLGFGERRSKRNGPWVWEGWKTYEKAVNLGVWSHHDSGNAGLTSQSRKAQIEQILNGPPEEQFKVLEKVQLG